MEKGADFIEKAKQAYTVDAGSPECAAWLDYFDRHIGARPYTLQMALLKPKDDAQFTMPTQWPEWFDSAAAARG